MSEGAKGPRSLSRQRTDELRDDGALIRDRLVEHTVALAAR